MPPSGILFATVKAFFGMILLLYPARSQEIRRKLGDTGLDVVFSWTDETNATNITESSYYELNKNNIRNIRRSVAYRPGQATNTHSCNRIRGVPNNLRSSSVIKPSGLSYFYQKYTEAYGIPVLASRNVPDSAVKRACYVTRFLMADHSEIRNWYYKLSGRVAVIGAREQTTDIPEHSWLPSWWNQRARGLGATKTSPVSTGGEENVLCYTNDRYHDEDIFLHEFSHGVHLLGAKYAIAGWDSRLQRAYQQAKYAGRWRNTYAMSTYKEYFAEGTQSYFNCNAYANPPNGIHNSINTRDKLRTYDPTLYSLISEVFPCRNNYLKRCNSNRGKEDRQVLRMNCDRHGETTASPLTTQSASDSTKRPTPPQTTTTQPPNCFDQNSNCANWARTGECTKNPSYMLVHCKRSCNRCDDSGDCQDLNVHCADWARRNECTANPAYMHVNCKRSCNICGPGVSCVDRSSDCSYWSGIGECHRNPVYMRAMCQRSCGIC